MEITPKRAIEKFEKFANDDKQMFLLHGTRAVNLISLLRDGFLVDPQNTQINGRLFGDVRRQIVMGVIRFRGSIWPTASGRVTTTAKNRLVAGSTCLSVR